MQKVARNEKSCSKYQKFPKSCRTFNLVPRVFVPLTSGRKTRALGATILGMRHRCRLRSETGWAEFGKMVASRAHVFRPLDKGNEGSGNEIGCITEYSSVWSTQLVVSFLFHCLLFFCWLELKRFLCGETQWHREFQFESVGYTATIYALKKF